jgi:hypothetical protein
MITINHLTAVPTGADKKASRTWIILVPRLSEALGFVDEQHDLRHMLPHCICVWDPCRFRLIEHIRLREVRVDILVLALGYVVRVEGLSFSSEKLRTVMDRFYMTVVDCAVNWYYLSLL